MVELDIVKVFGNLCMDVIVVKRQIFGEPIIIKHRLSTLDFILSQFTLKCEKVHESVVASYLSKRVQTIFFADQSYTLNCENVYFEIVKTCTLKL